MDKRQFSNYCPAQPNNPTDPHQSPRECLFGCKRPRNTREEGICFQVILTKSRGNRAQHLWSSQDQQLK